MDRVAASGPGRIEIAGRWFGVRGRRFVRPTLTLRPTSGGSEVRALADLEHKPWAAQDGDVWLAAFDVDVDPGDVVEMELSVAPDIAIALRRKGRKPAAPGDRLTAGEDARAPVAKAARAPRASRRPSRAGAGDLERVSAELASATQALDLERERRAALDQALEDERAVGRELRTELAKVRAEVDLAHAAQAEAAAAAVELEAARRELRETHRRHEELSRNQDQTTQAHAEVTTALHERSGALESAREALAAEQAETARLRSRLAQAEQSGPGVAASPDPARRGTSGRAGHSEPAAPGRAGPTAPSRAARSAPSTPVRAGHSGPSAPGRGGPSTPGRAGHTGPGVPVPVHPQRPLNPSLRHRTWWLGRMIALLFLLVVLAAIYVVIHSTIKH